MLVSYVYSILQHFCSACHVICMGHVHFLVLRPLLVVVGRSATIHVCTYNDRAVEALRLAFKLVVDASQINKQAGIVSISARRVQGASAVSAKPRSDLPEAQLLAQADFVYFEKQGAGRFRSHSARGSGPKVAAERPVHRPGARAPATCKQLEKQGGTPGSLDAGPACYCRRCLISGGQLPR